MGQAEMQGNLESSWLSEPISLSLGLTISEMNQKV